MSKKVISIFIFFILLVTILIRPALFVLNPDHAFFARSYHDRYEVLKSAYNTSQYVKKKNPSILSDEFFEEFAGGFFLKGNNPILIVHDHPPLGRYLISLSIFLFDNSKTVIVFLYVLTILSILLMGKEVLKNYFLALIPVALFINEPLFFNKLVFAPLPEPIQLPFILLALLFFIKGIQSKRFMRWFILCALMIGFVISTRFFVTGFVLTASFVSVLILIKKLRSRIIPFCLTLPIAVVVLFVAYTKSILDSGSILEPLRIQKYILAYHDSKFIKVFSFWDLIIFNRWHTWWDKQLILPDKQWQFFWPISVILTVYLGFSGLLRKIKITLPEVVLLLWLLYYSMMLSAGYTSTRYFLPILPILYILSVSMLKRMWFMFRKTK